MRKSLVKLLLVVVLFAGWVLHLQHELRKLSPRGTTAAEHLMVMPEPRNFRVFSTASGEHLAVHGPIRSPLTFPSGGPVYIYGPDGQLVDWTADSGDDERFHQRWPGVYNGRQLSRDEATQWTGVRQ